MKARTLLLNCLALVLAVLVAQTLAARPSNCGLTCFSWKKCKAKLSTLTNTGGDHRPGQSGTTGQLFFNKCGDPPSGCECTYEEPKKKPKFPKSMLEFVNKDAKNWLMNLVETI